MQATKTRRSPFRPLLLGAGAVVILGVAGYLVAASALDPNRLRDDLQDAVLRQTGRVLTIAGPVHLALGLSPQFVVENVSLANLPGGSRPQMLTARSIRAQLALLPLLGGDAVISALTVEEPDLLVERVADGTPNWRFVPEHRALYQGHGSGGSGGGDHRVEIRTFTLHGGQATWRPAQGPAVALGIERLTVSAESSDSPMTLAFRGTRLGAPVTITGSSGSLQRLQGGPVSALAGAWPVTLDAESQGTTLHVEGGFNHPEQGRAYQLRVTFTAPSLEKLNTLWPAISVPPLSDVNATALLSDGSQGEFRTSQVSVQAGASDLSNWAPGLSVKQVTLSAPGPGQLIQVNLDGSYQDQPLRAAANTMQPDVIGTGGPMQVSVTAQAAGGALTAHGTVPQTLNGSGLDMTMNLHVPDLSALSSLVGHSLPPAHDLSLDAQIGDAGVKLRGIAVRNLSLSSSLVDATGQFTLIWSPRLSVEGTLASHSLDLDSLSQGNLSGALPAIWPPPTASGEMPMPAPSSGATGEPAPNSGAVANPLAQVASGQPDQDNSFKLARLRDGDADLNLSVGALTFGGKRYTDLQAHLQLTDGKLALNPFRAQAPEGTILGGVSIDATSDQPPIAVTLRSPSIAASAVAGFLGYPGGASGTMQVDAQLSGVGQSGPAIAASLDGHVGLAMVNGQVEDSLVQGLIGQALDSAGVQSFGGGSSQVRCFAMRIDFSHGQGVFRALSADTSRLALDGDGQLDLASNTADLHLRPRIRLGPTEVAAPVSLRGSFGQMKAQLDPVMGGGRFGLTIGSAPAGPSACASKLAVARGGLGGPLPAAIPLASTPDPGLTIIRKPKDLLKGLFH